MENVPDCYVQVGQVKTRYWTQGARGSVVLLVHGLGGFIENWQPSFTALAAQHRVYALDLPGHGLTDKPSSASYGVPELAAFVKEFITTLGLGQVNLVGHSLGGAIAIQLALQHPDVVTRLVIVDSVGLGKEAALAHRLLTVPVLGEILSRPSRSGTARTIKMFIRDPANLTDEVIDVHYRMWAQPGSQQALLKAVRQTFNFSGQRQEMYGPIVSGLPSLKVPTLVVWGRQDATMPVSHAQVAAQRIPNARVEILDDCGHNVMLEQPKAFNALLTEFLAD